MHDAVGGVGILGEDRRQKFDTVQAAADQQQATDGRLCIQPATLRGEQHPAGTLSLIGEHAYAVEVVVG